MSLEEGLAVLRAAAPARSRGTIALVEENCTVCMLCARECPDWCLYVEGHTDTVMARAEAVELLDEIRWAGELVGKSTADGRWPEEETVLAAAREDLGAEPSELQADLLRAFLAGRRA